MRLSFSMLLALLLTLPALALAQGRILEPLVPQDVLDRIKAEHDDGTVPLPRHLTEEEAVLPWVMPQLDWAGRAPPQAQRLDTPPEYALNKAIMMRWATSFAALQTEIVVAVTTRDERANVVLFVESTSQRTTVTNSLTSAGANMGRVQFLIQAGTGRSVWMRDYGPRFINADHEWAIIDHTYDRPRPADNLVPSLVAQTWAVPIYDLPLRQGGGNYHSFGNGEAFVTTHILTENPSVPAAQVQNLFAAYQGVDLTLTGEFPSTFDSTRHIDMWMLPVSDDTVIIGEYPDTGGIYTVPRQVTEATAAELRNRGYTVLRTPGRRVSGAHYTYTNSVIVNNIVLVCQFTNSSISPLNAGALQVFAQAFPDKDIIPINCQNIIGQSGAAHCIVKHVPFPDRIRRGNFD